jgi:hypothetical protein
MGLAVYLACELDDPEGQQWLADEFVALDPLLAEAGLDPHREAAGVRPERSRAKCTGFPYSFLHYLRRVYAQRKVDPSWVATPCEGDPTRDPAVDEETFMFEDHLLCHSDAEGYYLPVDFAHPLSGEITGGFVGSSVRLLDELRQCAPALGIELVDGTLTDEEAERVNALAMSGDLEREYTVWIALFEAARLSVAHRTAIVFG